MDKQWWEAAGIRALKTAAQTAASMIGVSVVMQDVDWFYVGSASLLAAILSFLTSLQGLPEVEAKKELEEVKLQQSGEIDVPKED